MSKPQNTNQQKPKPNQTNNQSFGTEDDKTNCPFYSKTGTCRHGDKCIRVHNKPQTSDTLIIKNMYENTLLEIAIQEGKKVPEEELKEVNRNFENFYEEVFLKLAQIGCVEEMIVCDNLGSHLNGNVVVKYKTEEEGIKAMRVLSSQFYKGRPIVIDYSPVTDFNKSICKLNERFVCDRGGYCNYFHLKYISNKFRQTLFDQMYYEHPEYIRRGGNDSRTKSKYKNRYRSTSKSSVDSNISEVGVLDSPVRRKLVANWDLKYMKYSHEADSKKEIIEENLLKAYKDIKNKSEK